MVFLTFDDGPDPVHTPMILDMLDDAGMQATFFVVGALAARAPVLVRETAARGHEIGNHSYSHPHPRFVRSPRARREVADGAAAIADILGQLPRLFRAPHGTRHPAMLDEARALGEQVIHWDLSAVDWGPLARPRGIARRLAAVHPGNIVLMHDGGRGINRPDQLVKVLPHFLERLVHAGLDAGLLPGTRQTNDRNQSHAG